MSELIVIKEKKKRGRKPKSLEKKQEESTEQAQQHVIEKKKMYGFVILINLDIGYLKKKNGNMHVVQGVPPPILLEMRLRT